MSFTIRNASLLIYISANFIGTAVAFAPPSPATKSLISSTYYRDSSTTKNFDFYRSKYSTVLSKKDENIIGESELGAERPSLFEPGGGPTVIFAPGAQDVYQQAIFRTMLWVTLAGGFGFGLWAFVDSHLGEEFFAGYLVEQSLSVDNLFVFLLLFDFFRIPLQNQDKILNWGIYGAIIMRAVMIGLGAVAIENFRPILLVFAGILVYSSAKILIEGDEDGDEDMSQNSIVQFSKKLFDSTDKFDGDKFFTLVDGVRKATPLFLCMIAIEISDVVFAVDSIPAVFGVTEVGSVLWRFFEKFIECQ
jgi:predicted tellurium resistance membrane protein TerC